MSPFWKKLAEVLALTKLPTLVLLLSNIRKIEISKIVWLVQIVRQRHVVIGL